MTESTPSFKKKHEIADCGKRRRRTVHLSRYDRILRDRTFQLTCPEQQFCDSFEDFRSLPDLNALRIEQINDRLVVFFCGIQCLYDLVAIFLRQGAVLLGKVLCDNIKRIPLQGRKACDDSFPADILPVALSLRKAERGELNEALLVAKRLDPFPNGLTRGLEHRFSLLQLFDFIHYNLSTNKLSAFHRISFYRNRSQLSRPKKKKIIYLCF